MSDKELLTTKVVTPEIICSFPYLFEKSDYTGKYGMSIPIPESDKEFIKKLKTLIGNAAENKWGKASRQKIGKKIVSPLRSGNDEKEDDEVYQNTVFFSANSSKRPGVVNKAVEPILDQDEIYPGCIVRASVNFYGFDYKGKEGIACGLQNVMKVRDGEPIGGISNPEDDFDEFKGEVETPQERSEEEEETEDVF